MKSEKEISKFWGNMHETMVSIICPTYNHEKYIDQALKGFLNQKTDFPFKIIIHDDASTDETPRIIDRYAKLYPNIINPVFQKENQFSKGMKITPMLIPRAKSKYIAFCEGDDYWTDPYKLKKQVNFLEQNPQYAMCSHDVSIVFEDVEKDNNYYGTPIIDASFDEIVMSRMFIAFNSIVYKREHLTELPEWALKLPGLHKAIILLVSSKGNNYHFRDNMGVKRRNPGSITIVQKKWRDKNKIKYQIYLFEKLKKHLSVNENFIINKKLASLYKKKAMADYKAAQIFSFLYSSIKYLSCKIVT